MASRPFRFTAQVPDLTGPIADWRDELAWLEDAGFSTVALADHFTGGYTLEPLVLLATAAAHTTSVRLQTAVLGNDYRHPVLTHRMAATLDLVSGGRLELGIGAGWMRSDYERCRARVRPAGSADRPARGVGGRVEGAVHRPAVHVRGRALPDARAGGRACHRCRSPIRRC